MIYQSHLYTNKILGLVLHWNSHASVETYDWPRSTLNRDHCLTIPGIETAWVYIAQSMEDFVVSLKCRGTFQMDEGVHDNHCTNVDEVCP